MCPCSNPCKHTLNHGRGKVIGLETCAESVSCFLEVGPATFAEENVVKIFVKLATADTSMIMTSLLVSGSGAKDLVCGP